MNATHALPHTIAELIKAYNNGKLFEEMQALDRLFRQLSANWFEVVTDPSQPTWDYALTIPASTFLATAELSPTDVEYINQVLAHVSATEPTSGVSGMECDADSQELIELATNDQRVVLRQIFQNLDGGLTLDMINGLRAMLPGDGAGEYVIRPAHLPAIRVLHVLLLRTGFWPKLLQDLWLDVAEAGYDPTAVPPISDDALAAAHTNRQGEYGDDRVAINGIFTYFREVTDDSSELYGELLHHRELALMLMASLVSPKLAAFSDAYWRYVERLESV